MPEINHLVIHPKGVVMPDDSNETTVKVTLREIYDVQQNMLGKLTQLLTKIEYGNHEHRIAALEKGKWMITGISGAVAGVVTVVIGLFK